MTAQAEDIFRFKGAKYALVGVSGGELFDPGQLNLAPEVRVTASWRGYVATFAVYYKKLILDQLEVSLSKSDCPSDLLARSRRCSSPTVL